MDIHTIPPWLGTAIAGAALAVIGHVWTNFQQWRETQQKAERIRRSRLAELVASIRAGDAAWAIQCENRERLNDLVAARMPSQAKNDEGYDQSFALAYSTMTPDERALHDVIRGITIHTIRPINRRLRKWLQSDTEFRVRVIDSTPRGRLAGYLNTLEVHLILWEAKYQIWIPGHPERALVYLADEKQHGIEFPKKGVQIVNAVLTETGRIDA